MIYKTEMITVDTVIGFTAATLALARSRYGREVNRVVCTVSDASISFWCDGSTPTSTEGHIIDDGESFIIGGEDVVNFKAIKVSGAGKIPASYEV